MLPRHHKRSYGQYEELFSLYKGNQYVLVKEDQRGYTRKDLYRRQQRRIFSSYVNLDYDICIDRIYRINTCGNKTKNLFSNF